MLYDGLDYNRTVEANRLVFKGQLYQKNSSYGTLFMIIAFGLLADYKIYESVNPTQMDYFVTIIILVIVILVSVIGFKRLSNRDKLKEIETSTNSKNVKTKLLKAASNLKWRPDIITKHYVVFQTKYEFSKNCQSVTLIFFPDNRIYFNSLHYPNEYLYPARFMENYQVLMKEYLRIEKE